MVVALAVTFVVLVFSREVSRSAHLENSARLSENLSFGAVATTLLTQENAFDAQLASLLTTGSRLSRTAFDVQLSQLSQDLTSWSNTAGLLKAPTLSPQLNVTLAHDTITRVSDFETVLTFIKDQMGLGATTASMLVPSLGEAQLSLSATAASWGTLRHELSRATGHVTLMSLTNVSARLNIPRYVQTLLAAPHLSVSRAIVIAAVQVQPAPFPAPPLTLLLPPVTTMQVQIAVSNLRVISQPVTLSMVLTPLGGPAQTVTMAHTLLPLASFAFDSQTFNVFSGEKGTFSVTLNGVPATSNLLHSRTYELSVSASGLG